METWIHSLTGSEYVCNAEAWIIRTRTVFPFMPKIFNIPFEPFVINTVYSAELFTHSKVSLADYKGQWMWGLT